MKELKITTANITEDVPTAVWIATLILTYENFEIKKVNNYWFEQKDIKNIAQLLCTEEVESARVSQWCNGDHENNTYNYLRSKDSFRRLTQHGEFSNIKEIPTELPLNAVISSEANLKLRDLLDWYNTSYSLFYLGDK